ncbi:hypothetical protein T492DRAFT_976638, partial [Pavlovales sp. CCMP2436]
MGDAALRPAQHSEQSDASLNPYHKYTSGSAWFNRCCSVTGLVDGVSVCAPAPTPRLGRASAAAALPWRPQRAASS